MMMTMTNSFAVKKTMTTKYKMPKRRVQFASSETNNNNNNNAINNNNGPPAREFLSTEEIESRWYSKKDEKVFKRKTLELLAYCRSRLDPHSYPRGIEGYTKLRFQHRKDTISSILFAYRRGIQSENVAILSQQRSLWNTQMAAAQASIDYIEVLQERAKTCI